MTTTLVMTVLSDDRPGIVDALSGVIESHGANWEESRMASLSGQFAGILKVRCPDESVSGLRAAILELESGGLTVTVHDGTDSVETPDRMTLRMHLTGHDQPGIVQAVTHAIHNHGVNVEELESERAGAPLSAGPLFTANLRLSAPRDTPLDDLREELETLSADLMVDISVE